MRFGKSVVLLSALPAVAVFLLPIIPVLRFFAVSYYILRFCIGRSSGGFFLQIILFLLFVGFFFLDERQEIYTFCVYRFFDCDKVFFVERLHAEHIPFGTTRDVEHRVEPVIFQKNQRFFGKPQRLDRRGQNFLIALDLDLRRETAVS